MLARFTFSLASLFVIAFPALCADEVKDRDEATLKEAKIDFAGPALEGVDDEEVEAVATGNANVQDLKVVAQRNTVSGGWRVMVDFQRGDAKQPVELRAFLRSGTRTLSETWSYALPAE